MFSSLRKSHRYIICYWVCSLLFLAPALAGDPVYPVFMIPDSLKKNAHAVKRMEEVTVKINDPGDVRVTTHSIITILDPAGDKYAQMVEVYNKLADIRSIRGVLYDEYGKQLKKLKQSDISDVSGSDDESLMTDNRYKVHSFYHKVYPYTIEYEIEMKYNQSFILPDWTPQEDEPYAVQQSKLTVITPKDYVLRYRNFVYNGEPVKSEDDVSRVYTWEVKNLVPLPDEYYTPVWHKRTATVMLAASQFEMQQYKGSMNTWEEFGSFYNTLNQGKDQLPESMKQTVHQLTDGLSRSEKIAKLYQYLQQHTRYVSIQLGIGGFQSFDANYVVSKGYGDCKALSNYMCALLKEAGVKASPVLVYAGENAKNVTEVDFPSSQFNHVIVCAPDQKDTTWLECTSNTVPAGYLSSFTADRPVLMIDEKGGKLIRTPAYGIEQNVQSSHITAKVLETGDMSVNMLRHSTGTQQDVLHSKLHALTREKLMENLKQAGYFASYDVNGYEWKEDKSILPSIDEHVDMMAHNYATIMGKRIFIEPNLMNRSSRKLSADSVRRSDIYLNYSYRDIDTVKITVPEGYVPESMPQAVALKSPFGEYSSKVAIEANVITYIRAINHRGGTYPASDYPALVTFYNSMYKADRSRIVLVKK